MIRRLTNYLRRVVSSASEGWDRFWFTPVGSTDIGLARMAIGMLAAIYTASWLFDLHHWIEKDGRLNVSVTRFLIGDQLKGTGSIGRVSILYGLDSIVWVRGYLIGAFVCSIAMALGLGGRVVALLVWILILGIVHRVPMLQGAGDLLFTGILGYLIVDPGKTKNWASVGLDDRAERWTANLALRLMQVHVIVWLAISLVSHLAEPMWWSGSAVWWLASGQRSPWFSQVFLSDKPYLINALTHGFLLLHLLTIVLFLRRGYRPLAISTALLMAISIWGLTGDWLYSFAIFASTSCFWGIAVRELEATNCDQLAFATSGRSAVEDQARKGDLKKGVKRSKSVTKRSTQSFVLGLPLRRP